METNPKLTVRLWKDEYREPQPCVLSKEDRKLTDAQICKRWRTLWDHMKFVATQKQSNFRQGVWCIWKNSEDADRKLNKVIECKTAACLAGHATTVIPNLRMEDADIVYYGNGITRKGVKQPATSSDTGAFSQAMGINYYLAAKMVSGSAYHQTAKKAAEMVGVFCKEIHKELGRELS